MSTADDIARRACRMAVEELGDTAAVCDLYDAACAHAFDIVHADEDDIPDFDNHDLYEAIEGEVHRVLK